MISGRFAPHLALLLLIALVPTVIHTYVGMKEDDGRSATGISEQLVGFSSQSTDRRPAWGAAIFDSHDWFERLYHRGREQVRLFVGRSFNQKRLYHHPEIALSRGVELELEKIVFLPDRPQWPVHLMRQKNGQGLAAYLLYYDGRFVQDPVSDQLRNAVGQMFAPRRPMTLFYVAQQGSLGRVPFAETAAARILTAAVEEFLAQQRDPR